MMSRGVELRLSFLLVFFKRFSLTLVLTGSLAGGVNAQNVKPSVALKIGKESTKSEIVPDLAFGAYQRGHYLTAFKLALPKAKLGDPASQTLIAEMYDKGYGVPKNLAESTAWYALAAENGNLEAQFSFAVKLLEGKYVKPDVKKARSLMLMAAKGGHATAAFNVGQFIISQRPTSAGTKQAMDFFMQAANGRVSDAYYTIAKIYESGQLKGFPEMEKAQDWMLKAAKAGIDTAQVELAIWLVNGKAGIKEPEIGFQWMKRAALGGNVIGQNRIAKMLVQGVGTKPNIIEGVKWHFIARRAGLNDQWLDEIVGSLKQDQLAKALRAANRWPSG